jgi:hypothetical protein
METARTAGRCARSATPDRRTMGRNPENQTPLRMRLWAIRPKLPYGLRPKSKLARRAPADWRFG